MIHECDYSGKPKPKILSHRCVECGKVTHEGQWFSGRMEQLKAFGLCHTCDFWITLLSGESTMAEGGPIDGTPIIAAMPTGEKHHYVIAPEGGAFRGFGGRLFRVEFLDGHVEMTSNLWQQGEIPAHLADRFEVNTAHMEAA